MKSYNISKLILSCMFLFEMIFGRERAQLTKDVSVWRKFGYENFGDTEKPWSTFPVLSKRIRRGNVQIFFFSGFSESVLCWYCYISFSIDLVVMILLLGQIPFV